MTQSEPLGLYLHVPFCIGRCPYCDFNSSVASAPPWQAFCTAVEHELLARAPLYAGALSSVYLGGGTPSLAPPAILAELLRAQRYYFSLPGGAEVTIEVNPATLDERGLAALGELGFNRLSIGWQSSHDCLLRVLGRRHDAAAGKSCAQAARRAGFDNVSLDLIFAVPGETLSDLEHDLAEVVSLAPEHVSVYALTYHEGTELQRRRAAGEIVPASEELETEMMELIETRLVAAGFEHYEVSSYARPGRRAVHNSLYWTGARYLGVGAGAHSFTHEEWRRGWRWETRRSVPEYLSAWSSPRASGLPPDEDAGTQWVEILSADELLSERMLCGMRLSDGVDLDEPALRAQPQKVERGAQLAIERGWAVRVGSRLQPTALGMRFCDSLAGLFF